MKPSLPSAVIRRQHASAQGSHPAEFRPWRWGVLTALLITAATLGGVFFGVAQAQDANGAITGLALTSDTPGELVVSWDMPSPAPSDYRVDWAELSESYQSYTVNEGHVYPEGNLTTVTITGLEAGAEYKVRMRARYNQGEHANSPWSGPWAEARLAVAAEAEPTPTPEPTSEPTATPEDGAIGSPTATGDNAGRLVIAWQAPQAPHDAPSDYRVNWARSEDDYPSYTEDHGNAHPTGATQTLEGLDDDTEYKIRIRARYSPNDQYDAHWSGPWTEITARVVSSPPNAPAAPNLIGTAVTPEGNVTLLWLDPADDTIIGYRVLRGPDADSLAAIQEDTGSTAISYTDTEPPTGQTHAYAVQARSAAGLSPLSNTRTATVPANEEEPVALRQQGVTTLVSNLDNASETSGLLLASKRWATSFTTNDDALVHNLTSLQLRAGKARVGDASAIPIVAVHRDNGGQPGALLYTLDKPDDFLSVDDTTYRTYTFSAPEGAVLRAGETYWVVYNTPSDRYRLDTTDETSQTGDGWMIGDISLTESTDQSTWEETTTGSLKFAVIGSTASLEGKRLVSNLDNASETSGLLLASKRWATSFTTDDALVHNLTSLQLRAGKARVGDASAIPIVAVHRDNGGQPGALLYTLDKPDDFLSVDDTTYRTYTFSAPEGAVLRAGETYWVVYNTPSDRYRLDTTDETSQTGDGWMIGDISLTESTDQSTWEETTTGSLKFAVIGSTASAFEEEPGQDLPGAHDCHLTDGIVLVGHTSSGHLTAGIDTDSGLTGDCFRLETRLGRQYRVEVKFGDTESVDIGGSAWIVYTGHDFHGMSSLGSAVDHNREDGRTFTDFKHIHNGVKSYFVDVAAYDLYNEDEGEVPITYHGPYTITMKDITGVQRMVTNRSPGTTSGPNENIRLGSGNTKIDLATQFTTGSYPFGYQLDRIRAPFHTIAASGASPLISIHRDSSGDPGAKLCDVGTPAKIVESAVTWSGNPPPFTFLARDCAHITLAASTPYWVAFSDVDYVEYLPEVTDSDTEHAYGSGWIIGNAVQYKRQNLNSWSDFGGLIIRFELWARPKGPPNATG